VIGHYDLHDGQLRRTQYLPDQPSPPSAALYEALHHPAGANPAGHRQAANLSHLLWGHAAVHASSVPYPPEAQAAELHHLRAMTRTDGVPVGLA